MDNVHQEQSASRTFEWGIERYGPTQAVSDSYLLLLEPMSPGNHIITFLQTTLPIDPTTSISYTYDITYLIHVV
jgi:hypothetical protein